MIEDKRNRHNLRHRYDDERNNNRKKVDENRMKEDEKRKKEDDMKRVEDERKKSEDERKRIENEKKKKDSDTSDNISKGTDEAARNPRFRDEYPQKEKRKFKSVQDIISQLGSSSDKSISSSMSKSTSSSSGVDNESTTTKSTNGNNNKKQLSPYSYGLCRIPKHVIFESYEPESIYLRRMCFIFEKTKSSWQKLPCKQKKLSYHLVPFPSAVPSM